MRKLAYLLLTMLLLGRLEPARACKELLEPPYETFLARASTVFVGHVFRTKEAGTIRTADHLPPVPVVEGTFRVVEVLKGQPPADGNVRARAHIHCNMRLLAGQDYAIFLYEDNFIWGVNAGTTHLMHVQNVDAKRLLEQIREERREQKKRLTEDLRAVYEGKATRCGLPLEQRSDEQKVANAATVFVGRLTRTEEVGVVSVGDLPPTPVVEGTFQILEVLKGRAPPDGKVRTSVFNAECLPFLAGNEFLVFLDQDRFIRGPGDGTMPLLTRYEWTYTQRWLERFRDLSRKANGARRRP
jgi:hypothetical protein